MSGLKIDTRTYEDIMEQIRQKAASYTPEWRFDEKDPDAGTALASIYAQMLSDTIGKLNQVLYKNKIEFYNCLGADLKPSVPAHGHVTFSLVNQEVAGSSVLKGTKLYGTGKDGNAVIFETVNDLFVTNAIPEKIFVTDAVRDYIANIYDSEQTSDDAQNSPMELRFFDCTGNNLQSHEWHIAHTSVFHIQTEGDIILHFKLQRTEQFDYALKDLFCDSSQIEFSYKTSEGYQVFPNVRFEGDYLILHKSAQMPQPVWEEYEDEEGVHPYQWLRCRLLSIEGFRHIKAKKNLNGFFLENMFLRSRGSNIRPQLIVAAGDEPTADHFFPFGERPTIMQEVYFVSEEVLGKKNAQIHLSFDLEYGKFEIENQIEQPGYNWKTIMKKTDFNVEPEYDITITQVVWEYYNGTGWTRLFPSRIYEDLFHAESEHFQEITINFRCPSDIEPFLVGSVTSYSIRARVMKMANLYKMKGNYISPCVSRVRFKYEYRDNTIVPDRFVMKHNLEQYVYHKRTLAFSEQPIDLLLESEETAKSVFIGFQHPIVDGPVKMMLTLKENFMKKMPALSFTYSGKDTWSDLDLADETENMRKTGMITMMGSADFSRKRLFGEDLFWIKISDVEHAYQNFGWKTPIVTGFYMNTVGVKAIDTRKPEYFDAALGQRETEYELEGEKIHSIEVWVNEVAELRHEPARSPNGMYGNHDRNREYEYNKDGTLKAVWVKWQEVPYFHKYLAGQRVYVVNRARGVVRFSDGTMGKQPQSGVQSAIRVQYSCGGGSAGNLSPGQIDRMVSSIGFIGEVCNFAHTIGGCDEEQMEVAAARAAARLRHTNRAVTAADYEAIAMEADPNIIKVKCISNYDAKGQKKYGHIALVILWRDYLSGSVFFDVMREIWLAHMKHYMSETLIRQQRFHIVEPVYIMLSVMVTAVVPDYDKVFDVRDQIKGCLERFLDPVAGNFDGKGWKIGESPNESQIQNVIKDIRDILYIKYIRIDASGWSDQTASGVDYERLKKHPFILPVNGMHQITVDVENTRQS